MKRPALEIILELSKGIIGMTVNQRAICELLERIEILENRVKDLELMKDK